MKLPRVPQRTTPGFAFSMVDRALRGCLAVRQFGRTEIAAALEFFGADPPECVYCGSHEIMRWDHLVPIKSGGETVLGNVVPACARCDDSKRDVPFEEWIVSDVGGSPKSRGVADIDRRIERIKTYVQHFGYGPASLEERLTENELERLAAIRLRLSELRQDVEALIQDYRTRTSGRGSSKVAAPTAADFQAELDRVFRKAETLGLSHIDVKAGALHCQIGGYPGPDHRIPVCCGVMRRNMKEGDEILCEPPSGQGATLEIRYKLPR